MNNPDKEENKQQSDAPADPDIAPEIAAPAGDSGKKAEEYYDQLLRLQAEFINFRRRAEREKADAIRYGRDAMVERMISLLDVMDQALKHADGSTDVAAFKQGFKMVVSEFHRFLKSEGLEPLPSVGSPFDPHLHEAVEQVATEKDDQNGIVLEELQKGYKLHGKLFRPARVKVGQKAGAPAITEPSAESKKQ